jgi:cbb3-type cytochrome oxidase subunit 1
MNWIVGKVKGIMLVSGVLTCTMLYAAIAPQAALRSNFAESLEGPVAEIVVRNWGALITLMGAMLIYGAFNPLSRRLILVVAGLSKLIFIALVLTYGRQYLGQPAGVAVVIDLVWVVLFAVYLFGVCRDQSAGQPRLAEDAPKGGAV